MPFQLILYAPLLPLSNQFFLNLISRNGCAGSPGIRDCQPRCLKAVKMWSIVTSSMLRYSLNQKITTIYLENISDASFSFTKSSSGTFEAVRSTLLRNTGALG